MYTQYVSEADFVCRFLAREMERYALSHSINAELHLEESIGDRRADLTVRRDARKLLVVEAKIDKDPWDVEVIKEGFGYASEFDFFATCNPESMILFQVDTDPFESALALINYGENWVAKLFELTLEAPHLRSLYRDLLVQEGVMDEDVAEEYYAVKHMEFIPEQFRPAKPRFVCRLIAINGLAGHFPSLMGNYWDKEIAMHNKTIYESRGFEIKLQVKDKSRWVDLNTRQSMLDG